MALSKNSAKQHDRSKHIDVRYHFVREQTEIAFEHVPTSDNVAYFWTESLGPAKHKQLMDLLQIGGGGACRDTIYRLLLTYVFLRQRITKCCSTKNSYTKMSDCVLCRL